MTAEPKLAEWTRAFAYAGDEPGSPANRIWSAAMTGDRGNRAAMLKELAEACAEIAEVESRRAACSSLPDGPVADERERCATLCVELACMVDDGAGAVGRLWQAARNIRNGKQPIGIYKDRVEPDCPRDPDAEARAYRGRVSLPDGGAAEQFWAIENSARALEDAAERFTTVAPPGDETASGLADSYLMAANEVRLQIPAYAQMTARNLAEIKAWDKASAPPKLESWDAALAAPSAQPSGAPEVQPTEIMVLLIEHDGDDSPDVALARNRAELLEQVKLAVWGESHPADTTNDAGDDMAEGMTDTLIETGVMTFEGDPPLRLVRIPVEGWFATAPTPSGAPADTLEMRFDYEGMTPLEGMDRIYAEYATTFGRYPDAFMARVVAQTKEDLFAWWAAHREEIRAALAGAPAVQEGGR